MTEVERAIRTCELPLSRLSELAYFILLMRNYTCYKQIVLHKQAAPLKGGSLRPATRGTLWDAIVSGDQQPKNSSFMEDPFERSRADTVHAETQAKVVARSQSLVRMSGKCIACSSCQAQT